MFHLILLQNDIFQFFCQRLKWQCCSFGWLYCWKFSYFVQKVGISWGRKREKVHLIFIIHRSSNSKFYKITGLNSSEKKFRRNHLVNIRFFWNWFVLCSISPFCAPITENIAVRLRLLFFNCFQFNSSIPVYARGLNYTALQNILDRF